MSKEILGHVTCPHCGNKKASVHRQAKGSRALYYRCYPEEREPCGTVQIILAGGQKWLKANMRPLNTIEKQDAAETAAEDAKREQIKVSEKVKAPAEKPKGMFDVFLEDEAH